MQHDPSQSAESNSPQLIRGISLGSATALNMIDMIGVGPFITIPLIVSAMGGPQAMLGWILGALFAICDVWFGRSWVRRCQAPADRTATFAKYTAQIG